MQSAEIREKFLSFFEKRGHKIVPSSSLIPDDPSVLLTTAGMQQFKKYYTGEADSLKDFGAKNTASIQKSFRTSDIDEVGDDSHLTFFEMLGNFSFGGYFKKEAITYAFDFITKELNLPISYVTVFEGSDAVPKDEESKKAWNALDVTDVREQGMNDVFWGPTGSSGPCGPTTEIYCENPAGGKAEVWNIVFNEFFFPGSRAELLTGNSGKKLERLETPGVDTGMGLERLIMIIQNKKNIFETDLFISVFNLLLKELPERERRIIADHLRGATFLLADDVRPSNKERGYILRRLIRRVLVYEMKIPPGTFENIIKTVIRDYGLFYPELEREKSLILDEFKKEREKFILTLSKGVKELSFAQKRGLISATEAFRIYETFGLPYEAIKDLGEASTADLTREQFDDEFKKHQEISRAGQEKKFGGHGLILHTGELKAGDLEELKKVTRLHTVTHLLNAVLRKVLGPDMVRSGEAGHHPGLEGIGIQQQGSDITSERTRFDFTFPRKLTPEEIKNIEERVNELISRKLEVKLEEIPYEDAINSGALRFWREKYPAVVKVYTIYDPATGEVFSKELCGGPHVKNTSEIGYFRIIKEESSSAGIRRIRATVE